MRRLMTAIVCVMAAAFMAAYGQEDDRRVTIEDRYTRVDPAELAMFPDRFVERAVEVKDRFNRAAQWARVPAGAARFGVSRETHVVFRTSPGTGSNMLCFVARRDEEAMRILEGLVEESPITMTGEVAGRVGADTIFIVNRIFRGHVEPSPLEKMRLVITFRSPDTEREVQYTIPELNRFFTIRLPDTNQPVHVKIELR